MIVASLTTTPARVPSLGVTLATICAQDVIDHVLIAVEPALCAAVEQATRGSGAEVIAVEDIGPGKKHLIANHCAADDLIVTFDDDFRYAPGHARGLVDGVSMFNAVCGYIGFDLNRSTILEGPASYLNGGMGWAYRAAWLQPADVLAWGRRSDCWHSDDVYLGSIFRRAGRAVRVIRAAPEYLTPEVNIDAWVEGGGLAFHSDRLARGEACERAAWTGLPEGSS